MNENSGPGVSDETNTKLIETARRNLRHFIGAATFKCEADRNAALSCLEVIEDRLDKAPASEPLPDAVEQSDYDLAEQVVSAANIVTNGGYYEIDIDAVAKTIARHRLSAMPASSGEVGWRDIASAPKDGTHVLVLMSQGVREAWWNVPPEGSIAHRQGEPGMCFCYIERDTFTYLLRDRQPTHWQPLPAPPHRGTDGSSEGCAEVMTPSPLAAYSGYSSAFLSSCSSFS